MLKKISKLFLGLVVCAGSACVTPTHASSAPPVVLVHIQAASPFSAKDEMISIYNNSSEAVNISHWCLKNKANVKFACYTPYLDTLAYYLLPGAFAVVATESFFEHSTANPEDVAIIYPITNQSSGSLVNSSDTLSLVNAIGETVDSYSWTTAIPSGKIAQRVTSTTSPQRYETLDPLLSWKFDTLIEFPLNSIDARIIIPDVPEPLEDEDPPVEPEEPTPETSVEEIRITELLANPEGSDTGNEFIELYNPNQNTSIDLSLYRLKIGASLEKTYSFPVGSILLPSEYRAFFNTEITFTLLNSTSSVQLFKNNQAINPLVTYSDPPTGKAYALVQDSWIYTAPSPNEINQNLLDNSEAETDGTGGVSLQPCAPNQYRSTETNRCRLLAASASSTPRPCAEDQYRSPETNRCRSLASQTSAPAPCKASQERNPDTNRCRTIQKMTSAEHGVKGAHTTTAQSGTTWYFWLGIIGIVGAIVTYGIWEWREELLKLWRSIRLKFARTNR